MALSFRVKWIAMSQAIKLFDALRDTKDWVESDEEDQEDAIAGEEVPRRETHEEGAIVGSDNSMLSDKEKLQMTARNELVINLQPPTVLLDSVMLNHSLSAETWRKTIADRWQEPPPRKNGKRQK